MIKIESNLAKYEMHDSFRYAPLEHQVKKILEDFLQTTISITAGYKSYKVTIHGLKFELLIGKTIRLQLLNNSETIGFRYKKTYNISFPVNTDLTKRLATFKKGLDSLLNAINEIQKIKSSEILTLSNHKIIVKQVLDAISLPQGLSLAVRYKMETHNVRSYNYEFILSNKSTNISFKLTDDGKLIKGHEYYDLGYLFNALPKTNDINEMQDRITQLTKIKTHLDNFKLSTQEFKDFISYKERINIITKQL